MKKTIKSLLNKEKFSKEELIYLLESDENDAEDIFRKASEIKEKYTGKTTYFRGLIEYSNKCAKSCYYCGIRKENRKANRYTMTDKEVLTAAKYAIERNWGSVVIQAGEFKSNSYTEKIEDLIKQILELSSVTPGITLSLGEQNEDTYRRWYEAGAKRYLLRIETSNRELYYRLHPDDKNHCFDTRVEALKTLQKLNFMTGTGVMIGLPYQTFSDLADDLIFMQEFDIDMCGMGPYIEHNDTPIYNLKTELLPLKERLFLSYKMIALLRIMMKDINIASSTALQAIDPVGREKGIEVGANVIMPNITPVKYHENYHLYKGKPQIVPETDDYIMGLVAQIERAGDKVGFGMKGDPLHYLRRTKGDF